MTTILLVDDSAVVRNSLAQMLSNRGYDVVEAPDGLEALEQYALRRPEGVLMDLYMPRMDGMAALRELVRRFPGARVALMTAGDVRSVMAEARAAGAVAVLAKPLSAEQLLAAVRNLTGGSPP
ncbi:MAG: response regulator [Chloroflexi bacterium]|nr:response regulator [Chloroflexota bacterium]